MNAATSSLPDGRRLPILRRALVHSAPALALLTLWQVAVAVGWLERVPSPLLVLVAAGETLGDSGVWWAFASTLGRTLGSFVLSAICGLVLGVVIGTTGSLGHGLEAVVDFLRSIPAPALLPVFLSIFGLYSAPKIAFAVFVCFLVNVVYAAYGVRREQAALRSSWVRVLKPSAWFILHHVVLPGAATDVLAGLRVTLSLALILSTLAEYILLTGEGAGILIRFAYEDGQRPTMYALILLLGLAGYGLNLAYLWVERHVRARVEPGARSG